MPDKQTQTQAVGHNAAPDGGKLRPARQMRNIPPLVVPNNSQFVCCPAAAGGIFFLLLSSGLRFTRSVVAQRAECEVGIGLLMC